MISREDYLVVPRYILGIICFLLREVIISIYSCWSDFIYVEILFKVCLIQDFLPYVSWIAGNEIFVIGELKITLIMNWIYMIIFIISFFITQLDISWKNMIWKQYMYLMVLCKFPTTLVFKTPTEFLEVLLVINSSYVYTMLWFSRFQCSA